MIKIYYILTPSQKKTHKSSFKSSPFKTTIRQKGVTFRRLKKKHSFELSFPLHKDSLQFSMSAAMPGGAVPTALVSTMMSKPGSNKPFTYCPGGVDFSELKSPKMSRRIAKNQNGETTEPRKVSLLFCEFKQRLGKSWISLANQGLNLIKFIFQNFTTLHNNYKMVCTVHCARSQPPVKQANPPCSTCRSGRVQALICLCKALESVYYLCFAWKQDLLTVAKRSWTVAWKSY